MTFGTQNTEAEGHAQLDWAMDHGINFIDTAELYAIPPTAETYGRTEEIIGTWLASRRNRDRVVVATKIAGEGPRWIRNGTNRIDRANILQAVDESLHRLQTDYIDLYQLHWPNRDSYHFGQYWGYAGGKLDGEGTGKAVRENFREVLETLAELQKQGKIRHAGLSNETAWGTMQYLQLAGDGASSRDSESGTSGNGAGGLPRMVSIQNEYNLLNRLFEPDLAEIALREQIGLLAWSPLATGLLTGKYVAGGRPAGSRWARSKAASHRDTPQSHSAVEAYRTLARNAGLSLAQMALAFVHSRPFVTSVIIGATRMEQLQEDVAGCAMALNEDVLEGIARIRRDYPVTY